MTTIKNNKFVIDKYDTDDIVEVYQTYNESLDETLTSNLDYTVDDDDICTSISRRSANPLYTENSSVVNKIALPTASLVEDDRFWREQVSRSDGMATEVLAEPPQEEVEEIHDQQIVTLDSSTSSSIDSFTPNKTIKDRIPNIITKWSVSLLHGNLLIVGYDKDGKKSLAKVCNRRISSYIFHDSNDIVCSLFGPSELDSNVPKYIRDKFKMGIPEDWHIVIQYWQHYKSLNSPVKYSWPALPPSYNFDQTTNWYEAADTTDTAYIKSGRKSLTTQQITKEIAKLEKLRRAIQLKESFSSNKVLNKTNRENSIKNDSLSNRQIDSISLRKVASNNNLSNVNRAIGSNFSSCASEAQNILFPGKNNFEKVPAKPVDNSSESEESEIGVDTSVNKTNDDSSICTESSLHLEPLVSESSPSKSHLINENQNQKERKQSPDIFSSSKNQKIINKKIDASKTNEKEFCAFGESSSVVSLHLSDLSKVSSIQEATTGKKTIDKKVLNSGDKLNNSLSNTEISVSSRGRTRITTLPFWQGSRSLAEKDCIKIISSSQNSNDSEIFRSPPRQKLAAKKSDIVKNSNKAAVFLKPANIDSIKKRGRKKNFIESEVEETIQEKSTPKTSTNIVKKKTNIEVASIVAIKKQDRKKPLIKSGTERSESSPEKYNKIMESNAGNSKELLKSPKVGTIKKRAKKMGFNKSDTERSQSPEKSLEVVLDSVSTEELRKSPKGGTIKKRAKKPEYERIQSESSPEKSTITGISKIANAEKLLESAGKNKFKPERSQSEPSGEKSTKILSNADFLKPPDIETIKKKRGRKKGGSNSTLYRSDSNVSNDVSSSQMSYREDEVSRQSQNSVKELTPISDYSVSSNCSSISSRGRRRVNTLPFWEGHRLTVYKEEIMIQKSIRISCNIDSYVNDNSNSIISVSSESSQKSKLIKDKAESPVQSYQEVFNKTVFKKPGKKSETVEKPVTQMQLMSTFNNETINKSAKNNFPDVKLINVAVKNNANKRNNVDSNSESSLEIKISEGKSNSPIRNNITSEQASRKSTMKQLKELKNTPKETNENLSLNPSPLGPRTRSASKKLNYEKSPNYKQGSEKRQLKNPRNKYIVEDEDDLSMEKKSRPSSKKQNDEEEISNNMQSSQTKQIKSSRKNIIVEDEDDLLLEKRSRPSSKKQNDEEEISSNMQSSQTKQIKSSRKNIIVEDEDDLLLEKRSRPSSKKQNDEEEISSNMQSSQTKQIKSSRKNNIVEDEDDLLLEKKSRPSSKKQNDEEEISNNMQSSQTKQIKSSRKNIIVEEDLKRPRPQSPCSLRTQSPTKKQNDEVESPSRTKLIKTSRKNIIEDDLPRKESPFTRSRSPSKKQNYEDESSNLKQSSRTKQIKSSRKNYIDNDLPRKESLFTRRNRSSSIKQNDEEESPNYKQSSYTKLTKSSRKNSTVDDLPLNESPFTRSSRSPSKKKNDDYKQSSRVMQLKNPTKYNTIEDKDDLTTFIKRNRSRSKKKNDEEESSNYEQSSHIKQLKNHVVQDNDDLSPKNSPLKRCSSRSPSKKQNDDYKQSSRTKQLKNPRKYNTIEDNGDLSPFIMRSRSRSKKKNDEEESPNYDESSHIKQLKNLIAQDKDDLSPRKSPFKIKTRSVAKKLFADELEINQLKNSCPEENNKNHLGQLKVLQTKSSITESQNTRKNLKRNHSSQKTIEKPETDPSKRRSDRHCPEINNYEKISSKSNKLQKKIVSSPISHYNTRSLKSRSKKSKAENNFNFTIQNISNIEENIPNKKTIKHKKKSTRLSAKKTTQFKAPKKRKNKQFVLPPDPSALYLLVNKHKKSKKKETISVEETAFKEPIRKSDDFEPKKRKMFLGKNWMKSEECIEYLSQINQDETCTNSKFVLTLNPVVRAPEFDLISEVSGMF